MKEKLLLVTLAALRSAIWVGLLSLVLGSVVFAAHMNTPGFAWDNGLVHLLRSDWGGFVSVVWMLLMIPVVMTGLYKHPVTYYRTLFNLTWVAPLTCFFCWSFRLTFAQYVWAMVGTLTYCFVEKIQREREKC